MMANRLAASCAGCQAVCLRSLVPARHQFYREPGYHRTRKERVERNFPTKLVNQKRKDGRRKSVHEKYGCSNEPEHSSITFRSEKRQRNRAPDNGDDALGGPKQECEGDELIE